MKYFLLSEKKILSYKIFYSFQMYSMEKSKDFLIKKNIDVFEIFKKHDFGNN